MHAHPIPDHGQRQAAAPICTAVVVAVEGHVYVQVSWCAVVLWECGLRPKAKRARGNTRGIGRWLFVDLPLSAKRDRLAVGIYIY
jgi:hypothetical protein